MNKREHVVKADETFGQGQWDLALKKYVYLHPLTFVRRCSEMGQCVPQERGIALDV
jgi:hypothetical protein